MLYEIPEATTFRTKSQHKFQSFSLGSSDFRSFSSFVVIMEFASDYFTFFLLFKREINAVKIT